MNPLDLGGAALSALLLLTLAGCGTGDVGGGALPSSSPSAPAATSALPESAASTTPSASKPTDQPVRPTFEIVYANGKVTGDTGRLRVKVGSKVTISVRSDVADVIHLHGYDITAKVAAGGAELLTFNARIPGVFALELEKLGKELAKVQVQ